MIHQVFVLTGNEQPGAVMRRSLVMIQMSGLVFQRNLKMGPVRRRPSPAWNKGRQQPCCQRSWELPQQRSLLCSPTEDCWGGLGLGGGAGAGMEQSQARVTGAVTRARCAKGTGKNTDKHLFKITLKYEYAYLSTSVSGI